jgi:dihydrofolate reductase
MRGRRPPEKEAPVSATVLYMSMSLDGFITGPNASDDNGLGDGGERLHEWIFDGPGGDPRDVGAPAGINGQIFREFMSTGAVVAGRGTFEPADGWHGDHHDGVPIFIYSRRSPGIEISGWPNVTYVTDVPTAMRRAKAAAGDSDVLVHGGAVARLALEAGVLDELEIHLVPVLLGEGRRLFDGMQPEQTQLERTRVLEGEGGVTHLHYRVLR